MSLSASKSLQRAFVGVELALLGVAILFGVGQNYWDMPGGPISPAKVLWLVSTLTHWFIVPAFLIGDVRLSWGMRRAALLFLLGMVLRGVIELWMMFVSLNWSPYYGIGHDLLMMALLALLIFRTQLQVALDTVARRFLILMFLLFPFEIYFAWYMKTVVQRDLGSHLYYVPNVPEYAPVLQVTWIAVALVLPLSLCNSRRWFSA